MAESELLEMSLEACVALLRASVVGRLCFVANDWPVAIPVNFRLVETSGRRWLAVRTRPGNLVDQAPVKVAFEVDDVDPAHRSGWSVLVCGTLHRVDADAAAFRERFDPDPWILAERESWLVVEPAVITGRELRGAEPEWPFVSEAYL
jgi:nitroimidazol reductase NimA-like FMN-containing flavoprotein (pyridoxamine 5'-phosphate oxidase superfamily)